MKVEVVRNVWIGPSQGDRKLLRCGETHDLSDSVADDLIRRGAVIRTKMVHGPPEDKSMKKREPQFKREEFSA